MPKQINHQIVRRLKKTSRVLSVIISMVGFFALVGWQFNILFLMRVIPKLPIIAPNTAMAFLLGGAILFLAGNGKISKNAVLRIFSYFSIIVILLLGLLTLLEYIFKVSFGIDGMLFSKVQGLAPVRMSPQSAFNFLMTGISLLFIFNQEKKTRIKIGQIIVLLTGAVSLLSLFGFIYSIPSFYTIAPYKGMAAHTAVAFVMMFFGILLAFPEHGFVRIFSSRGLSGLAARRLFFTLMVIIFGEVAIAGGREIGLYNFSSEALFHLAIITGVFVYLIFFAFRSLDELGRMETSLAKTKELDRAKTEFVGMASHQLRTPLTAISWYSEMLLSKDAGELSLKQADYLKEIYTGNQRMIDLVDDLLNTSRIDMGTLKAKPELISLTEVMDGILDEFSHQIKQKNLNLEKKFSRNLPRVLLDPEHLGIIFQNIISNAVKYTQPRGKILVEIRKKNSHVLVKIADNGWGIPPGQQKKIFTKLFRADNVRKRDAEGTGLGLYIARALVKKSGGEITFESKEGKGSAFYVTFKV
ncbi:MAG TPA: HAMP domain-containing sensor histidine kinase [Candidatus Bathyarchaeia archaeon]|nr:HAMP domain-containing sensor histidine kinase [Candidatus Bathyarchaeia archaeon]